MKLISSFVALALLLGGPASAHYTYPGLIVGGVTSDDYVNVRMTNNHWSHNPVQDVTSIDLRCYTSETNATATTAAVTAGSTVGFRIDPIIGHFGPLMVYMAKAPSSATGWDGSGSVWFKIYEVPPVLTNGALVWPSQNLTSFTFTIPKSLPDGEYLIRPEHIALHGAATEGGAQFYMGCAQVKVTGGGSGSPTPKVAIPGAYTSTDPGILFQPYYPVPTSYVMPGPTVWKG
ncbi:glycoside hydrolase [Auriculariales sp. MPI-PUGE-AT-0066]|nr:glycoside hydrolase [Auriculariales sp. MPI-PUGE-AT-0066]